MSLQGSKPMCYSLLASYAAGSFALMKSHILSGMICTSLLRMTASCALGFKTLWLASHLLQENMTNADLLAGTLSFDKAALLPMALFPFQRYSLTLTMM
jgi:hypothetical protein